MGKREEFLAAIIKDRDDDGPRLVFADWLEEHGGEPARAEFIRVQCAIAAGAGVRHSPRCRCRECKPQRRSRELAGHCPAPHAVHTVCDAWAFRRGFVADITCTAEMWLGGECQRCEGSGRSGRRLNVSGYQECPDCRDADGFGTGRLPGHADALMASTPLEVVRLTTWPQHEYDPIWRDPLIVRARLVGRKTWRTSENGPSHSDFIRHLLAAEWPTLRFELPPAEGRVPDDIRAPDVTTAEDVRHSQEAEDFLEAMPAAEAPSPRQQFRQFLADMNRPPRRPGGRRRR